ncbi:MAG: alpha/beta hydrolase-fold protein [Deltaproteobacteria bacterium]|nr:alpha/beta hydrolase-fold protein [Deltaproteobacteria bacterium]
MLGGDRDLLVHLPAGYESSEEPWPVVFFFHGYLDRPIHLAPIFIRAVDNAVAAGEIKPFIAVFPDISIGGTGADDPATSLDERLGSWGVNSNLGRFEDFIVDELVPWVGETYRVRRDAAGVGLAGYSAGGFAALKLALKKPWLAQSVAGLAADIDARYAIGGSHLRPYNARRYKPITKDQPRRAVFRAGKLGTFTDEWAYWPVFDSDREPGPVWKTDRPVWERLRAENPMDLARSGDLNLRAHAFYLVAGDRDAFFFQHHIAPFTELLTTHGARVDPETPIHSGTHAPTFLIQEAPDLVRWFSARFEAAP